MTEQQARHWAEATRAACQQAAQNAFEEASILGLCREGAIEAALSAIEMVDVNEVKAKP
ncbi:MAG: hypothetical protein ABJ000_19130 [Saccharospirillum sp.]|uniref:hypothetical protein n=1 Tax=Saccharospirillum sp. TaxID=2033801 RepID=UPI0032988C90